MPADVKALVNQATAHGISNLFVPGPQDRAIRFIFSGGETLDFILPNAEMLPKARKDITPGPYPLPTFYDKVYTGARMNLEPDMDYLFSACRVGEYIINNCA